MSEIFVTADLHFGHDRIIELVGRPFTDGADMNNTLIRNWNDVVKMDDVVYILGDFCFARASAKAYHWLQQLNGHKVLTEGNHDDGRVPTRLRAGIMDYGNYKWGMSHRAKDARKYCSNCDYFLCGHVHAAWKHIWVNGTTLTINVGVDVWDYRPVKMASILGYVQRTSISQDTDEKRAIHNAAVYTEEDKER